MSGGALERSSASSMGCRASSTSQRSLLHSCTPGTWLWLCSDTVYQAMSGGLSASKMLGGTMLLACIRKGDALSHYNLDSACSSSLRMVHQPVKAQEGLRPMRRSDRFVPCPAKKRSLATLRERTLSIPL
jgi:hypothetical protein